MREATPKGLERDLETERGSLMPKDDKIRATIEGNIIPFQKYLDKASAQLEEKEWIFTFGGEHAHPHGYVAIYGTFNSARDIMVRHYGCKWCWQYASKKDAGVYKYGLSQIKLF